jgi:hypothetical protein
MNNPDCLLRLCPECLFSFFQESFYIEDKKKKKVCIIKENLYCENMLAAIDGKANFCACLHYYNWNHI